MIVSASFFILKPFGWFDELLGRADTKNAGRFDRPAFDEWTAASKEKPPSQSA